jgi:N-acyl-D-aspartate/D-glutamate deacylase
VRLWSTEGSAVVETEGVAARSKYLARLEKRRIRWAEGLAARGGSLIDTTSSADAVAAVGSVLQASVRRAR